MKKTGTKLKVNVIADEMSIRRRVQWNQSKEKFDGFVDVGKPSDSQSNLSMAKEALVYMACGADDDFKIPTAYFYEWS